MSKIIEDSEILQKEINKLVDKGVGYHRITAVVNSMKAMDNTDIEIAKTLQYMVGDKNRKNKR